MQNDAPTALVVEDSDATRALYEKIASRKFSVVSAKTHSEASHVIRSIPEIAVVLCDLNLPDASGMEVLRDIKKFHPNCVSVLVTASPRVEAVRDALNERLAYRFIEKGDRSADLTSVLDECLDKHKERRKLESFARNGVPSIVTGMMEVLFLQFPEAERFSIALSDLVDKMVKERAPSETRDLRLAARLSFLGMLKVSPLTVRDVLAGNAITDAEWRRFAEYPIHSVHLLEGLPKMKSPCDLIRAAFVGDDQIGPQSVILRSAKDAIWLSRKVGIETARVILSRDAARSVTDSERQAIFRAADLLGSSIAESKAVNITRDCNLLLPNDILSHDIVTRSGKFLLARGNQLSERALKTLRALSAAGEIVGPIDVVRSVRMAG